MRVLCLDNECLNNFLVLEVSAAYYDRNVNGLVLSPIDEDMDDFCYPGMHPNRCDGIVFDLYRLGTVDLRNYGVVKLYSDHVNVDDELEE